jgi:hypothetical protein
MDSWNWVEDYGNMLKYCLLCDARTLSPLLYQLSTPTAIALLAIALSRSFPLFVLVLALGRFYYFSLLYTFISRGVGVDALTPVLGVDNDDGRFHYYKT